MLDQQVASPLTLLEQRLHLGEGSGLDLASLRLIGSAPAPRSRMNAAVVVWGAQRLCLQNATIECLPLTLDGPSTSSAEAYLGPSSILMFDCAP